MTLDSSLYHRTVGDQILEVTPDSLSSNKTFDYRLASPINPFFDFRSCIVEESCSPSPTASSTWTSSSEPSPMLPSGLSTFLSTLNEQPTPFPVPETRSVENVAPEAFCSEARYNNSIANNFDPSGYSEPGDGASQLDFAVPIPEAMPTRVPGFGQFGTRTAVQVAKKDNLWADPQFQVLSFGNERSGAVHAPHSCGPKLSCPRSDFTPRAFPGQRTLNLKLKGYRSNPYVMRDHWIQMARSSHFEESEVQKVFSKNPKTKVATDNTLKASALRRKHPAKFRCPVDGCDDDFTRKHNLENHLRSHCGVTDLICPLCEKGFTTIPVWKRHKKTCSGTASGVDAEHPKSFFTMFTAEEHEAKVHIS